MAIAFNKKYMVLSIGDFFGKGGKSSETSSQHIFFYLKTKFAFNLVWLNYMFKLKIKSWRKNEINDG